MRDLRNPFRLRRAETRVKKAHGGKERFKEWIGSREACRVALSALCSKVMSVGILLVAYELKATEIQSGIAHIECQSYEIPNETPIDIEPVSIWVAGECYDKA